MDVMALQAGFVVALIPTTPQFGHPDRCRPGQVAEEAAGWPGDVSCVDSIDIRN